MKRVFLLPGLLSLMISFTGCSNENDVVPSSGKSSSIMEVVDSNGVCQPAVIDLMAGQHMNAGNVVVTNDLVNLYVTYNTTGEWSLQETHLYVGALEGLPSNKAGGPKIGHFPYKSDSLNTTSYTYTIPLSSLNGDQCLIIAAHAVVGMPGEDGSVTTETAWGAGTKIGKKGGWSTYSVYCLCNGGGGVGGN